MNWLTVDAIKGIFHLKGNDKRRIASIGMYDGVHRGHRRIIDFLKEEGEKRGLAPTVVTFRQHPLSIVRPEDAPLQLGTVAQKMQWLAEAGIDDCILLDFSEQMRRLTARQFLKRLKTQYDVDALVVGFNNRMGHDRVGSIEKLREIGAELEMEILAAPALHSGPLPISSSSVRRLLCNGNLKSANNMLGRPYAIEGTVVSGKRLGRTLGYPTANIAPTLDNVQLPTPGVYAVGVTLSDGTRRYGMANVGYRPTVDGDTSPTLSIEVNIFDFLGYLYDQTLVVEFVERIRSERRFATLEKLKSALAADERKAREIFELMSR